MSESRPLRCYQYVNRPYPAVRQLLRERASEIFQRATTSAAARAKAIGGSLHAEIGGIDVAVDVRIHIQSIRDEEGVAGLSPVTKISLSWEALRAPGLFPVMKAELSMYPLTASETQLAIDGTYTPPLGAVGNAVNAVVGHRVADATVHRLLEDVVEQVRRELPGA